MILKTNCNFRSSGQAAIEMVFTLGFAVPLVGLTMAAVYFCWAVWIVDHAQYENLVCKQTLYATNCETQFNQKIRQALPWGKLENGSDTHKRNSMERKYRFKLGPCSIEQKIVVNAPE